MDLLRQVETGDGVVMPVELVVAPEGKAAQLQMVIRVQLQVEAVKEQNQVSTVSLVVVVPEK